MQMGSTHKTFSGFRRQEKIARLMIIRRDLLTKAETVMAAAIEAGVQTLVEVRAIITQFHLMIRRRLETGLTHGSSAPALVSAPRSPAVS